MTAITWLGESGRTYFLQLCLIGKEFGYDPDILVLCKSAAAGTWAQTYVGESEDFTECI